MYGQLFLLCAEAVYAVPVGTDVSRKEEYIRRASIVKHEFQEQLNRKSLKYNWHEADVTVLEGVFGPWRSTRREGDRRRRIVWGVCLIPGANLLTMIFG